MRIWSVTDTGLVRKENQDAYAVRTLDPYTLCVVCDGMGGTYGGQVASSIAVRTFTQEMQSTLRPDMTGEQLSRTIHDAVCRANEAIRLAAADNAAYRNMGTTLVSAIVREDNVVISNVGDSRAYWISPRGIRQVTRDHSLVEDMVENGELTPEEARRHPRRNLVTRALGPDLEVQTDEFTLTWSKGDFLLLCSDGLVNTVTDQEILFEVIHCDDLDGCLERMLKVAKERGAPDNITAILMMNI
jgi:protein phosphatase